MRVGGIRVGADGSWFVLLFFFIFLLSGQFRDALHGNDTQAYLAAVACALLLLGSVLLHELGHALEARRLGAEVDGIELFFFGGFTRRRGDARTPGEAFKVAAAGPAVTFVIAALCIGLSIALQGAARFSDAAGLSSSNALSPILLVVAFLGTMNVLLLVLNLVPALPLDGGQLLRAIVWWRTGDRNRATHISGRIGRGFGVVLLTGGLAALGAGYFGLGLWALFIGFLIWQNASAAIVQAAMASKLDGVTVATIMDAEPVAIPSQVTALTAEDEFFARYRWAWFPVVDAAGRLLGRVRRERIDGAIAGGGPALPVSDLLDEEPLTALETAPDTTLESLLASEPLRRLGALCAVDSNGVLKGVVTLSHVRRALQAAALR
jgi:Zn-dependent protease